jgi:hypothetical protein
MNRFCFFGTASDEVSIARLAKGVRELPTSMPMMTCLFAIRTPLAELVSLCGTIWRT